MEEYKSKRSSIKYHDEDQITDLVIGADGEEYVVTLSGKDWRQYDWILKDREPTARRMADYSHFVHLQHKDECSYAMALSFAINDFISQYEGRGPLVDEPTDPRSAMDGSV